MPLLDIQSFKSYRKYLNDLFLEEKHSTSGVTLAKFAQAFDMSLSALKMIMSGSRNLTVRNIHVIADALRLDEGSHQYFESLVLYEQSSSKGEKAFYKRRLKLLKKDQVNSTNSVRLSESRIISHWYYPALLIYLIDISKITEHNVLSELDFATISDSFRVSEPDIRKAVEHFKALGLLQAKTEEKIHFIFDKVSTTYPHRRYIKDVVGEGLRRMEQDFESRHSYFKAHTFTLKKGELQTLKEEYAGLIDRYMALASKDAMDLEVVQVNCQMFPISN